MYLPVKSSNLKLLLHALSIPKLYGVYFTTHPTKRACAQWVLGVNYKMASALDGFVDFVREKVQRFGWSHKRISLFLQENNPGVRGLSERSVRWLCHQNDIHKTSRLDNHALDEAVTKATSMVRLTSETRGRSAPCAVATVT